VSQPSASKHGAKESKGLPEEIPAVGSSTLQEGRRFLPPPVDSSRVVKKPVSHAHREDPREFQVQQLRRRFSPTEKLEDGGTAFVFQMVPSDPDFPFEMAGLKCVLHVPMSYPRNGRPSLDVRNQEMGRGYQINVERGFTALAEVSPQATLLELMNTLDKQLESLLTEQKAETVKIIPNAVVGSSVRQAQVVQPTQANINAMKPKIQDVSKPPLIYTQEQRRVAQERRDAETRQLEARLGRLPLFSKLSDGIAYNVPITPRRHADLPVPLQAVKTVKLFVPLLYPLQHCRIEILGVGREAAVNTEKGFERKVKDNPEMSLMGHINYLAQHMHILATEPLEEASSEEKCAPSAPSVESLSIGDLIDHSTTGAALDNGDYRSHIKVIPRPPEWAVGGEGEEDTDSDYSDSYDSRDEGSADELDQNNETHPNPDSSNTGPERGILLSFPSLELHGIELLELTSLSLTIKCDRCKEPTDISNLRHASIPHTESCKKCANTLTISFRRDLMHAHSSRAGYLDLDGCNPLDMLPSTFTPTCSACSSAFPPPGIVSVRGDSQTTTCRTCHQKLTFHIPATKFLLTHTSTPKNRPPPRKHAPRESLGISAGHELPLRGRCAHYRKSYRWFRFSCCSKVFPCDKCHDAATGHPNEHANRMICGLCGREQNYRPEDCAVCKGVLVGKRGTGFWEGGRGTREKGRMSRKGVFFSFSFLFGGAFVVVVLVVAISSGGPPRPAPPRLILPYRALCPFQKDPSKPTRKKSPLPNHFPPLRNNPSSHPPPLSISSPLLSHLTPTLHKPANEPPPTHHQIHANTSAAAGRGSGRAKAEEADRRGGVGKVEGGAARRRRRERGGPVGWLRCLGCTKAE